MHPLPATERPSGYRWRSAHWRKAKDLGIKGWRCRRWPEKHISNGSNQMVGICLLKPITSIMLVSRLSKSSATIEIQFTLALNSTLSKIIAIIQKQTKKNWATPCWADQDPAIFCVHMVWLAFNLSVAVEVIIRRVSVGQSTFLLWESSYQITWKSLKTNILETIWHVSKPTARIYLYIYVCACKKMNIYIYIHTYACR